MSLPLQDRPRGAAAKNWKWNQVRTKWKQSLLWIILQETLIQCFFLFENLKRNLNPVKSYPVLVHTAVHCTLHFHREQSKSWMVPTSVPPKSCFCWLQSLPKFEMCLCTVLTVFVSCIIFFQLWVFFCTSSQMVLKALNFFVPSIQNFLPPILLIRRKWWGWGTPWLQCTMRGEEKLFSFGSCREIWLTPHWIRIHEHVLSSIL